MYSTMVQHYCMHESWVVAYIKDIVLTSIINFARVIISSRSLPKGWISSLTLLGVIETGKTSRVATPIVSAGHGSLEFSAFYSLSWSSFASASRRLRVPNMASCMTSIQSNSTMLCRLAASTLVHLGESCHD